MTEPATPDEQTADRRARYADALKNVRMMRDGKNLDRQIDAILAVADAERENDRLTLEHDRRYIARLDFEYDSLRKENTRLRAENEGLDETLRGLISAFEKDSSRLRADRDAVLREEAAHIRAHCPDHLDSNSTPGAWVGCHCAVADDIDRRLTDKTQQQGESR